MMQSSMMMYPQQPMVQQPMMQAAQGQQMSMLAIQGQYNMPMGNMTGPIFF